MTGKTGQQTAGTGSSIWYSIPKISKPYLLVIGDISTGDYNIIDYPTEGKARKRQEQEEGLAKILKAIPLEQIRVEDTNMYEKKVRNKYKLESAVGCAVYRTVDKDHGLFTILSQNDVFLGNNSKIQLENAKKRKEKYTTNLKDEKNPVYGMFRDDQIIISALIPVE
ncbi:hypothetical protein COV14_01445 [Candidatus Woesearchaeota archaeon CG10_big_fil_rev_8_21_14_0_10_33_12]|nr:MAG: hypothetical protein COV14_01445 [Candidatus Woesearchaeota archaeon CG10_big_fil_rev_8_21_14_0_10_33_12]